MYVAAQRVRRPVGDETGINTFLYKHDRVLVELPDEAVDCGELIHSLLEIEPCGTNRVLSYLDIVTADEQKINELEMDVLNFFAATRGDPFPRRRELAGVRITFNCIQSLAAHEEVVVLWTAIQRVGST